MQLMPACVVHVDNDPLIKMEFNFPNSNAVQYEMRLRAKIVGTNQMRSEQRANDFKKKWKCGNAWCDALFAFWN